VRDSLKGELRTETSLAKNEILTEIRVLDAKLEVLPRIAVLEAEINRIPKGAA
jgi:hypothetical protein